ncbi:MAG: hypothetical protein SGBAC_010415 [Bacillariaceae sp.]
MFNRNSNQQSRPVQPSSSPSDESVRQYHENQSNEPLDDTLEPTPFREGTALQVSCPFEGSYALVHQSNNSQQHVVSNQPRPQEHSLEGIRTSGMPNRSLLGVSQKGDDLNQAKSALLNVASMDMAVDMAMDTNEAPLPSQSQKKRARSDQQLAILDAPNTMDDSSERKPRFRGYQKDQWDQQYQDLLIFKEKHGHCHVQHTYQENPALARWAKRQRYQYKRKLEQKQSSMSDARQQKLEDVGFVWDLQTMVWQERYNELVEYKKKYGNCNVPSRFQENPPLGMWVKSQRRQYKLNLSHELTRLTPERFQLLTNLGFNWEAPNPSGGHSNRKMSG